MDRPGVGYHRVGLVRGDVAIMALAGDYGKPRPVVVLQADVFSAVVSVVVVPLTSDLRPIPALFRIRVEPSTQNGLRVASDLMVDKLSAVSRSKAGDRVGHLPPSTMAELSAAVVFFLGF